MSDPSALCLIGLAAMATLVLLVLLVDWRDFLAPIGCPYCGAPEPYPDGWNVCPECGKSYRKT